LRKARDLFTRALSEDPQFSVAAFNLGQVNQLLSDEEGSVKAYRRAIDIDASYVDARIYLAGTLIESGDPDEAIRQLTEALRFEGANDEALAMLARAYWDKSAWGRCIEESDKAIQANPSNAQAHLWLADALRQLGSTEKGAQRRTELYDQARENYRTFLGLTNYSTPVYEWLAFHFVGFHLGSSHHADRQQSYYQLRNAGYLGLCITEDKIGNLMRARDYCERAISYNKNDPMGHFLLGNVNRDLYNKYSDNKSLSCEYLLAAGREYSNMLALNAELVEAQHARNYLEKIHGILAMRPCKAN
jgi:Tfp pilus assembly protein PilF